MRIVSVGGGPAGLYGAILLKKADPAREVAVLERNAPGDTFGFGVVFSDQTLANLREADPETHAEITGAFASWDAIDVHHAGATVRCGGNGFCGIARRRLLDILERRARELGVRLEFATEAWRASGDGAGRASGDRAWRDPEALAGADLVLAADGVGSATRQRLAGAFGPRLDTHEARYIWLGTTKAFETFTFVFRRNQHGCFVVHAYPYDARMGTFIVECDQATWRRAGLDAADEAASIRYCAELFAPELDGHPLVSNRSRWTSFVTVTNRTWHHGNVALLGDAAHTAHFSIGSGTKLAMEDAIALARAIERRTPLAEALADYESERRPAVERAQAAARESVAWFGAWPRRLAFPPPQFAASLLGRSGRITYDNLRRRDPVFAHALDRWFAARAGRDRGAGEVPPEVAAPPAFTPFRLAGIELANRMVASPVPDYRAEDGMPSERWLAALERAGQGGAALVVAGLVAVAPAARVTSGCAGLWDDAQAERWQALARAVARRARVGVQLVHAGARGATRPRTLGTDWPLADGGWPLVAASPVPYAEGCQVPAELDRAGMDGVRDRFAAAAARAAGAGFDLLELDFGHGYLLGSFISPLTNRRPDAGRLEGRLAFPLEVVGAVRASWPAGRPLSVRFTADDWAPGGLAPDEAVAAAAAFHRAGCDLVHPVAGQTTSTSRPVYRRGLYAPVADLVRNGAHVPTMVSGNLPTPGDVDTMLAAGQADLAVLGRPSLPDPPWLRPAGAGATAPVAGP